MSDGFIKLSRSLLEWDWHDEPKTGYLYIIMLLMANHEETLWRGEKLLRGQLLTGRRQLSIASGLTEDEVRTALGHLKKTGHVIVTAKSKYSVITLPKYDEHCCVAQRNPQQIPGDFPDKSPATSPAFSPASAPENPQQIPNKSPADPHIQELKELKEPKKGLLYPHALPPEDDEDDLVQRVVNCQRAGDLIRRFRLTDSEATLEALLEDAEAHGFDVLEAALKKANESDNRGGISVNFYRAILRDNGGRKQTEGYDPYAGVQVFGGS